MRLLENRLLAALPDTARARLVPRLEATAVPAGNPLYEAGERKAMLYFLEAGIVSLQRVLQDGASAELAVIGNEGAVGVWMFLGGHSAPWRAVAQSDVRALGLKRADLEHEFRHGGPLHDALLRYTQTLIMQISQTALCNRHHGIEQQLCRALLARLDRLRAAELKMTQEQIAGILGVRRAGITQAARKLQAARIVRYTRGRIEVLDRAGLEAQACECYPFVRKETERLLTDIGKRSPDSR